MVDKKESFFDNAVTVRSSVFFAATVALATFPVGEYITGSITMEVEP